MNIEGLKKIIPWWVKLGVKIIIGKLKLAPFLQKLKIFNHGSSNPERDLRVFENHFSQVKKYLPSDFKMMELGPGYSISSAVVGSYFGADMTYLVDKNTFANEDIDDLLKYLENQKIEGQNKKKLQYKYLTDGVDSLKEIADSSIDYIYSNAVLEHIYKKDFVRLIEETRRVLASGGVCSHVIDLKDHLGHSLNNLRFSEKFWESDLIHNSGAYTNRLRYSEILKIFKEAGFKYEIIKIDRFDKFPIDKNKLNKEYKSLSEEELSISSFHILLYPI